MAKLIKLKALTQDELNAKIAALSANITKLTAAGMEDMAAEFQAELDSLNEAAVKSTGVNRAEEFVKLFPMLMCYNDNEGELTDLTAEQITFIGEGLTLKLDSTGKLTFVKKFGAGNAGGTKQPSPYTHYHIPYVKDGKTAYEIFDKAAAAAGLVKADEKPHAHSVIALLKANGVTIKLADGDSMRREVVKLNKAHNLGVKVTLREDGSVIDLLSSKHETAKKAESADTESTEGEDETEG